MIIKIQKSKLCNFQIKNKKNFSFTKYLEKNGDCQIIKCNNLENQNRLFLYHHNFYYYSYLKNQCNNAN